MKTTSKLLSLLLAALLLLMAAAPSAFAEEPKYSFANTNAGLFAIDADGDARLLADNDWTGMAEWILEWKNLQSVSSSDIVAAGLKNDGTVVSNVWNEADREEIATWRDLVQVVCAYDHVIGLRSDGTVVSCGDGWPDYDDDPNVHDGSYDFSSWTGVKRLVAAVCPEGWTVFGLREDGTVLDTLFVDDESEENSYYLLSNRWSGTAENVVDLVSSNCITVAVRSDGTVIYKGHMPIDFSQTLQQWENIKQVAIVGNAVVGLRSDGTLVCTDEEITLSPEDGWRDIIAIDGPDSYYSGYLLALRSDCSAKLFNFMSPEYNDEDAWVKEVENWEDLQGCVNFGDAVIGWRSDGSYCAVGIDPALLN